MKIFFLVLTPLIAFAEWGNFQRIDEVNPIIQPNPSTLFHCPIQNKEICWEGVHTFNPGAVVKDGKVYLFYRAEDNFGEGIGKRSSRIGLAISEDGLHFERSPVPVLFPGDDDQKTKEWPGGCEDPRIVETEDGRYVMTYTQWNQKMAVLGIATSTDLLNWKKHGYAFANTDFGRKWSKSGSIVCHLEGDRLIAAKIKGKYWMYWGEKALHLATSDDLITWEPVVNKCGHADKIVRPRKGKFDALIVETGPPALLTEKGILLLYNGKNAKETGDPSIGPEAYSAGQLLFDVNDPTKVLERSENCFFRPEKPYETTGQYKNGTVFIQGLVYFQGRWFLYYGCADSVVGIAVSE